MKTWNVAIASDHAGYEMKEFVAGYLLAKGYAVEDLGTYGAESVDYPVYAHALGRRVAEGDATWGSRCAGAPTVSASRSTNILGCGRRSVGVRRSRRLPGSTTTPMFVRCRPGSSAGKRRLRFWTLSSAPNSRAGGINAAWNRSIFNPHTHAVSWGKF